VWTQTSCISVQAARFAEKFEEECLKYPKHRVYHYEQQQKRDKEKLMERDDKIKYLGNRVKELRDLNEEVTRINQKL